MEKIRELLNSFTEEDYKNNKVNLHIHTLFSDGEGDEKQILASAKEKGYKEVLYLDIREMRDLEESEDHQKYLQIFEKIKDKIDNPLRIFAPTTTVMSKGEVVSYSIGTVDSHQKNDLNILPPMTDSQIEELKELFREMF